MLLLLLLLSAAADALVDLALVGGVLLPRVKVWLPRAVVERAIGYRERGGTARCEGREGREGYCECNISTRSYYSPKI